VSVKRTDMLLVAAAISLLVSLYFASWPGIVAFMTLMATFAFLEKKILDTTERELYRIRTEVENLRTEMKTVNAVSNDAYKALGEAKKMISEHNIAVGFSQFKTRAQRAAEGRA
jgi:hypothetical protein